MQRILNTHDISKLLDMSPDDVNVLARKGVIKGYKIGKRWRFRVSDVKRFLNTIESGSILGTSRQGVAG